MNNYGTILSDLTEPLYYRTQLYQYEHRQPCMQYTTNLIQTNRHHIHLPDGDLTNIDSDLKGITRIYSRLPSTRYQKNSANNFPLKNFKPNSEVCSNKIIPISNPSFPTI